jgi:hypothetical protein
LIETELVLSSRHPLSGYVLSKVGKAVAGYKAANAKDHIKADIHDVSPLCAGALPKPSL